MVAPASGVMLATVARSVSESAVQARPEILDELADHILLAQALQ